MKSIWDPCGCADSEARDYRGGYRVITWRGVRGVRGRILFAVAGAFLEAP